LKYVVVAVLQDNEKVEDFSEWLKKKRKEMSEKLDTKRVMLLVV